MTEQEIQQNIQKIARHYGLEHQREKTIEECLELIQAIEKYQQELWNEGYVCISKGYRKHIIEEIADVQIMIKQMVYLMGCKKDLEHFMRYKIDRQLKRMKTE